MTLAGTDVSADKLSSPLTFCTTSGGTFGTIGAYQTLLQGSPGYGLIGTFSIPLHVKQTINGSDYPGSYSMTLTFITSPGT